MIEQKAVVGKLMRERGASAEQRTALHEVWNAQTDWTGTCRRCKMKLKGKIEDLKRHKCEA